MISRDALAHYTNWAVSAIMPSDADRWAQYANISFDLSVLDIFGALCSGATLYTVSKKIDKILFGNFILRNRISIINIVPSVTDLLIQSKQIINSDEGEVIENLFQDTSLFDIARIFKNAMENRPVISQFELQSEPIKLEEQKK